MDPRTEAVRRFYEVAPFPGYPPRDSLQALDPEMAPRLHALLGAYGRRTGIPVLLNTSFNVAGEPIVNRAIEGYSTFRRCGIDALVAGPTLVTKRTLSPPASMREAWPA